jgi:nicotinate-nucleotide pyrophosphorylase (carboxylating)
MLNITPHIRSIVEMAVTEDLGHGDITTDSLIPQSLQGTASIVSRSTGVVSGVAVAVEVFRIMDPSITVEAIIMDGISIENGSEIARINGSIAGILKGERLALNFLQRLSGIATQTSRYVAAITGTGARIIDTRKTTPGLRELEKYSIRTGGGHSHRFNLSDGILIKDNHIAVLKSHGMTLRDIIGLAQERAPHPLRVEVEVETVDEAKEALTAGVDAILLDNMTPDQMREVVRLSAGKSILEASGGINLDTVRAIADTGVDLISVGALTHSVRSLDLSLEID